MEAERWRRVDELYHLVLEKTPAQRAAYLDEACAGDPGLRGEVESLLAFENNADSRLDAAVREVAAEVSGLWPLPGSAPAKMGRYELREKIGQGGMGVVYFGFDPAIGRVVAIKTIRVDERDEESSALRERLRRESQAGGRLSHPNIVGVYDVGAEGETTYIVMEYVEGHTLGQTLREKPEMPIPEITRIVRECAAALDYAHSHGVIHRDIKPANILLDTNGMVKIADFGIAKVSLSPALTRSAVAIGSPEYMAPEQWRGEEATGQTDQYALAAVAYTMLAGRRPFIGDSVAALAAQALNEDPPAATRFNSRLTPDVDRVLGKALARMPADRYPTSTQFAANLEKALEVKPAAAPARARTRYLIGAAVVLAAALLPLAWLAVHITSDNGQPVAPATAAISPQPSIPQKEVTSSRKEPESKEPVPVAKKKPANPPTRAADPNPPADWENQGVLQAKQGNYREAVNDFTHAISAAPGYRSYFNRASAYQHLGETGKDPGDTEKAIADYSQALRYKPDSGLALHDRALCELRLNQLEEAARDFDDALKLQPDNPRTWNGRGAIYLKQRQYQQAVDYFGKAIQLDPNFVQAYKNRAAAEKAAGDLSSAAADLAQAKAIEGRNPPQ